jgi:phosphohistidine swiveling domain-containing protein
MMETVLNVLLGTKMAKLQDWREHIGHIPAMRCYQRLICQYLETVDGQHSGVIQKLQETFDEKGELNTIEGWEELLRRTRQSYDAHTHRKFPIDPRIQLVDTIDAVFRSWMSEKAIAYRQANNISVDHYTAVSLVSMKFGNMNINSGSGVYFTRNPTTGENTPMGEYLPEGQGDQVVDGVVTPMPLENFAKQNKKLMQELYEYGLNCEKRFRDMQELEFTVENGKLWVLQSRTAKREHAAHIRIAFEMAYAEEITHAEVLGRVSIDDFMNLKTAKVSDKAPAPDYQGLAASSGLVEGVAALSTETAQKWGDEKPVILVRPMTETDDLPGMLKSVGVLTETGGLTCHAAVVSRDMNIPAVVGAGDLSGIKEGDHLFIDGNTGRVWVGDPPEIVEGEWNEYAENLYQMLKGDMKVLERVVVDPNHPVAAQLPPASDLYIDTHMIKTTVEMGSLLKAMEKRPGFYILNLIEPEKTTSSDDLIWNAFGVSDGPVEVHKSDDEKMNVMQHFITDEGHNLRNRMYVNNLNYRAELTEAGWKVMETFEDLVSIAASEADVVIFSDELQEVLGDQLPAWRLFCEKAGKTIYQPAPAKYRYEILVDIFKGHV